MNRKIIIRKSEFFAKNNFFYRALNNRELEDRIKKHMEKIQVHRRKNYEDITEELESARRNLEMVSFSSLMTAQHKHPHHL